MKLPSILTAIAFATFAAAQQAPTYKLNLPAKVAPGAVFKGSVTVTFEEGWHGYQNPPTDSYQNPIVLSMKAKYLKFKKVSYPEGVLKEFAGAKTAVYEGVITIPFEILAPKRLGKLDMAFTLNFQLCNDSTCLPPGSVQFKGSVKVVK